MEIKGEYRIAAPRDKVFARDCLAVELDLPPRVAEPVDHAAAPLDDDRRTVEVDVEVVQLGGRSEPVGVHVHERRPADERRVGAREHERRALHRPAHLEPAGDAACQRRLAGAERTGEPHEVAGAQQPSDLLAQLLHRLG